MDNQAPTPSNPAPAIAAAEAAAPDLSAGFWLRAGAYMIDGVLVAIGSVVLSLILPETVSVVARVLLSAGYFTVMPVRCNGQTLGKMAAGVAIVRDDGSPLTYGRAFARWIGYLLSGLTLCLGFACAAFTQRKRALHDYLADTRVVRVAELGSGRKLAVILAGLLFPLIIVLGIAMAVAIPEFAGTKGAAGENAALARLALLRSAASSYAADNGGANPPDLNALAPKYIPQIEPAGVPDQPGAAGVETYGAEVCSGSKEPGQELVGAKLRDTGKWGYVSAPKAPCDGKVFIDSTRADSKGGAWTAY
jgi:uncharacterized RDD family membrane protein YckC/type II secretory pathway pseudopilin PulG